MCPIPDRKETNTAQVSDREAVATTVPQALCLLSFLDLCPAVRSRLGLVQEERELRPHTQHIHKGAEAGASVACAGH